MKTRGHDGGGAPRDEFLHAIGGIATPGKTGFGPDGPEMDGDEEDCPLCRKYGVDPFRRTPWQVSFDRFKDAIPKQDPPTDGTARVRGLLRRVDGVEGASWNEALRTLPEFEDDSTGTLNESSEEALFPLLAPWTLFHEPFRGRTVADGLLSAALPWTLRGEPRLLRRLVEGRLSAWKVAAVEPGASLTLQDRFSGLRRKVDDEVLSPVAGVGDLVLARVVTAEGLSFLHGWCSQPLRGTAAEEFVRSAGDRPTAVGLVRAWSRGLAFEALRPPGADG